MGPHSRHQTASWARRRARRRRWQPSFSALPAATLLVAAVLLVSPATSITCHHSSCADAADHPPCFRPEDMSTALVNCAPEYDSCQRVHLRRSTTTAAGLFWYRCASSGASLVAHPHVSHRHSHCDAAEAWIWGGGGFYDSNDRLNNYRYWCCNSNGCNDPAADAAGLPISPGVFGFSFSQDPDWSDVSACEYEVSTGIETDSGYNPVFTLSPGQLGACLPKAAMSDNEDTIARWAGGTSDAHWAAFCVACDLGGGRFGEVTSRQYMYRDSGCDWRYAEQITTHSSESLDICAQVSPQINGTTRAALRWSYTTCDTAASCPTPPTDGLALTRLDADCNQRSVDGHPDFVFALAASEVGVCLDRQAADTGNVFPPRWGHIFDMFSTADDETADFTTNSLKFCCTATALYAYTYGSNDCVAPEGRLPADGVRGFELPLGNCITVASGDYDLLAGHTFRATCSDATRSEACPALLDSTAPRLDCPMVIEAKVDLLATAAHIAMYANRSTRDAEAQWPQDAGWLATVEALYGSGVLKASISGGGVPAVQPAASDDSDFYFGSVTGSAISSRSRWWLQGARNVTWENDTRLPIGESSVMFFATDRYDAPLDPTSNISTEATGNTGHCTTRVLVRGPCHILSVDCGANGQCVDPGATCMCAEGWAGLTCNMSLDRSSAGAGTITGGEGESSGALLIVLAVIMVLCCGGFAAVALLRLRLVNHLCPDSTLWRVKIFRLPPKISAAEAKKNKAKRYADLPSFKMTKHFGDAPGSYKSRNQLSMLAQAEADEAAMKAEMRSKKGQVVDRSKKKSTGKKKGKGKVQPSGPFLANSAVAKRLGNARTESQGAEPGPSAKKKSNGKAAKKGSAKRNHGP
eukprot:SAG11_NODE_420_length_9631_cov_12.805558_3_plen_867_part_00